MANKEMSDDKQITNTKISNMTLYIPSDIYNKIMFWVDKSNHEVSWWGLLDYNKEDNYFIVKDVFLLKQKVGPTSTEIDSTAMAKLMYQVRESPYKLRWWGHSHVKMGVFWSGTDMDTIKQFSNDGWLLSSVFNQKREVRTSFLIQNPVTIFIDNIETSIIGVEASPEWVSEFEEKVEILKFKPKSKSDMVGYDDFMKYLENVGTKSSKSSKKKEEEEKEEEEKEDDEQMNFDFFDKNLFDNDGKINQKFVASFFDDDAIEGS